MTITMPYPPGVNRLARVGRSGMYTPKKVTDWKNEAAAKAFACGAELIDGAAMVWVTLLPKMNKDGSQSKVRLDVDAPIKVSMDALNGVAYRDDKQVISVTADIGEPVKGGGLIIRWEAIPQ
jgi:crossover junction endodeoxyribonuclease RusA